VTKDVRQLQQIKFISVTHWTAGRTMLLHTRCQ